MKKTKQMALWHLFTVEFPLLAFLEGTYHLFRTWDFWSKSLFTSDDIKDE